jgi:hypothetical protein
MEALRQLHGDSQFLATDALELYLSLHDRRGDPKFFGNVKLAFAGLNECLGDLPLHSYRREHANRFCAWMIKKGYRTSTIRRRLGFIRAVFSTAIRERELPVPNVFQRVRIPDLGKDAVRRKSFTEKELKPISKACRTIDDDNDARRIKTRASTRRVPLVRESLWAAQRVISSAQKGQKYAFPRYTSDGVCKADAASAAVGKWLKSIGLVKSAHSFRRVGDGIYTRWLCISSTLHTILVT